jgi:hypothetical protein
MVYNALDQALLQAGDRNQRTRQNLYYCDVDFRRSDRRPFRYDTIASAYVFLAAAVEQFITASLEAVVAEINALSLRASDIRHSLLAIAKAPEFLSLQDVRGLRMWSKRVDLLSGVEGSAECPLLDAHLPLDGRTIRPSHIDTIWAVFGFAGNPTPGARHRLALSDVADSRNLVAHGEASTQKVAGEKSINDVLKLVERIDELLLHIYSSANDYLDNRSYLR